MTGVGTTEQSAVVRMASIEKKNLLNFHFLTSCFATGQKYEVTCLGQKCEIYQNQINDFRKALQFILREEEGICSEEVKTMC